MPKRHEPMPGSLGAEVRRLRTAKGLTQGQLAELLADGAVQADISSIEVGDTQRPGIGRIKRLAEALGVTYEQLLAASGWVDVSAAFRDAPPPEPGTVRARVLLHLEQMEQEDVVVLEQITRRFVRLARRRGKSRSAAQT